MTRVPPSRVLVIAAAVLLVAGLGVGVYWFFFAGGDAPPRVTLSESDESSGSGAGPGDGGGPASISGTWTVVPGDASDPSFAGYRVSETVFGVGRPSEAVGRTQDVSGSVTIEGTTIEAAEFTADLSTLASDDTRRDNVLRGRGLEISSHPTATFRLTEPIELAGVPAPGERQRVEAEGELTLHGVTQPVTIPLDTALLGGSEPMIEVAGAVEIAMADYAIEPPNVAGVVTVEDRGTIEVHLFLTAG